MQTLVTLNWSNLRGVNIWRGSIIQISENREFWASVFKLYRKSMADPKVATATNKQMRMENIQCKSCSMQWPMYASCCNYFNGVCGSYKYYRMSYGTQQSTTVSDTTIILTLDMDYVQTRQVIVLTLGNSQILGRFVYVIWKYIYYTIH